MKLKKRKSVEILRLLICLTFLFVAVSCVKGPEQTDLKFPNRVAENAQISDRYVKIANDMSEFTKKEYSENLINIPRLSGETDQISNYLYN